MDSKVPFTPEQIKATISGLRGYMESLLSDLVAIDSTNMSPGEAKVQERMEQEFQKLDLPSDRVHMNEKILKEKYPEKWAPSSWSYNKKRWNVVASHNPKTSEKAYKGAEKTLVFNGHVDIVPIENDAESVWTTGPFVPTVRNNRLYGRGAGDMKGGLVCAIIAFMALRKLGFQPAMPVAFHTVLEEENTGNGALSVVDHLFNKLDSSSTSSSSSSAEKTEEKAEKSKNKRAKRVKSDTKQQENSDVHYFKPDAVIIPEPLPGLLSAQVGVMWLQLRVSGKPAHVLDTSKGFNAIEAALDLWYNGFKVIEEEWNRAENRLDIYKSFAHPINFNLGKIHGGVWSSSVPADCTLHIRVGFFSTTNCATVRKTIETRIGELADQKKLKREHWSIAYEGFQAEGCVMDHKSAFFTTLEKAHNDVLGAVVSPTPATCTTDARAYHERGLNVTCYGPQANSIHGIDESVCLQSMEDVAAVMTQFMAEWCGLVKYEAPAEAEGEEAESSSKKSTRASSKRKR